MYKTNWSKKLMVIITIISIIGIGSWYIYQQSQPEEQILAFDDTRDTQDILDIFKQNLYWLTTNENYSPEFMLKHRAPTQDLRYLGQLHINVLRNKEDFIGFVAYYLKKVNEGFLLFLAINPPFRGKGYAERLLNHAFDKLKRMGAQTVRILTRTNNIPAQKLYRRIKFTETSRDDGLVYFSKEL